GAAPIDRAILAGDDKTGVTIMKMDEQMDLGPVLAMRATSIGDHEDAVQLTERLAEMGGELLVETLESLEQARSVEQEHTQATLGPRLAEEEGGLDWGRGRTALDRSERARRPGA